MESPEARAEREAIQRAFGLVVGKAREDLGISQERLAEMAHLHRNYVGSIERGERNVSLHNILRLAAALGVPPDELVRRAGHDAPK